MKFLNKYIIPVIAVLLINLVVSKFYFRIDLTQDKRYTLSEITKNNLKKIDKSLIIDVLLSTELPPNYSKLRKETYQMLEEFEKINDNISFNFINPLDNIADINTTIKNLMKMGIAPINITINEGASVSQKIIYPWAIITYDNRVIKVPLLKNKLGVSEDEKINISIQNIEYALSTSIIKILTKKRKRIAIIRGNGTLKDISIGSYLKNLNDSYRIKPFHLKDSITKNPEQALQSLLSFDALILAKPTKAFTDNQKQILDQFVINGGKMLALIDQVNSDLDSIMTQEKYYATPKFLNIEDMLFKYGVRINNDLVKDLSFTNLVVASGNELKSKYETVPWLYAPLVTSTGKSIINKGVNQLRFDFANSIDTLKNNIKKTVLLTSSRYSKKMSVPRVLRLEFVHQPPDKSTYNNPYIPLAVLLEGKFKSVYKNRIKPIELSKQLNQSKSENKMIIISDGNLIKNQTNKNRPLELGYDKWTNTHYDNKIFLMNCINYLLDDYDFINLRAKDIYIPFLDKTKVYEERTYWQIFNILTPLILLILWIGGFWLYQKLMYTK